MTIPGRRFALAFATSALLATGLYAPGTVLSQTPAAVDPREAGELPTLAPIIERVSAAVVNISVRGSRTRDQELLRFVPELERQPRRGDGSGVIVDAGRGYVLTNHHVIENADRIIITLLDSRMLEAEVVGSDADTDIAVLRIEADDLTEMTLAAPDSLRVGDYVLAIGNPFSLSHTVTSGIVSALGRTGISGSENAYEDFIQTDASINPGNSGGALINLRGQLVGVNSAILSRDGRNIGIGFAIPIKTAQNVMTQLVEHGEVRRGRLGVVIRSIDPDRAMELGLRDTAGSVVTEVTPDSAAAAAGLRVNDVIVTVNGRPTGDAGALRNAIGLLGPGESVEVGFIREGQRLSVRAVLGGQPTAAAAREQRRQSQPRAPRDLADIDPAFQGARLASESAATAAGGGVLVEDVERDSPAWRRELRPGDIITRVNRREVSSVEDIREVAREARQLTLTVQRGGRSRLLQIR